MAAGKWRHRQSVLMLIGAGLLLPVIIVLAIQFNNTQEERRRAVERDALVLARQIVELSDARVASELSALEVLSTSRSLLARDWAGARARVRDAARSRPAWRAVVLRDAESGRLLFDTGAGGESEGASRPLPAPMPAGGVAQGIFRDGRYCPCAPLHLPVAGQPDLVLTLYLAPVVFQDILMAQVPPGAVAALVDGDGEFLARSVDYDRRVGTPATSFVRTAVARGGEGIYRGRTYEGLNNYSAYFTSASTGWSAHVAVDRSTIDGPRARSAVAIALGIAAALALAGGLLAFAAYDLRVRRQDQERLVQMQKAEAISQFTSTVIHDFRNILAVAQACVQLISRRSKETETLERAEAAYEALQRGARLTNQLLSFARTDGGDVVAVDIAAMLAGISELLRRALGDNVRLTMNVDSNVGWAFGNLDQLELALLNLASNARDAIDGEGEFTIHAARHSADVVIEASDTGPGIADSHQSRIFDAFFTTKANGRGTGLGLAQVGGAVRQAGGRVTAHNGPEGGAVFSIVLRATEPPADAEDNSP